MPPTTEELIQKLILRGECSEVEFKESFSTDAIRTLVAFANGYNRVPAGYILIGVDKTGGITGLKNDPDAAQRDVSDQCRNSCEPPLAPNMCVGIIESKKVLLLEMNRSGSRPHRFGGICYIRVGSTTRKATADEELRLKEEVTFNTFDSYVVPEATLDDLDLSRFRSYYTSTRSEEATKYDDRETGRIVEALDLARKGDDDSIRPTVAAILVFGREPQKFFPLSSVNAIRFRGNSLSDQQLDRREIKGTIDGIIGESAGFIQKFSTVGSSITSQSIKRVDITEYPGVAVREAISNAIAHRDYADRGSQIDLYMFDDRIEIKNPGTLGGGLTVNDLRNQSGKRWLRNPIIAGLLLELKYIEKAGTGIARMFRALQENGSPIPEFDIDNNSVKVILRAHPDYSAKRSFEEGLIARDRGETERARTFFRRALEIRPDYAEALSAWASLEGDLGSLEEARKLYRDSLEKNPKNSMAYVNWAMLEDRHGSPGEARKLYEMGSKIDPGNAVLWRSWATMERRLGNFPKAREFYKNAAKLVPDDSISWQAWGQLEIRCKDYDEAERILTRAADYATDDYTKAWIYSDLAFAISNLRRPASEVERYYRISLRLNPNSAQTNHAFSEFLRGLHRYDEAEQYRRRAATLGWRDRSRQYGRPF